MRQRKLLLPPFHGEAVQRYVEMISEVAEREIDRWPLGETFALAPRMQAVTLDVIMSGVFGIEGRPGAGTTGYRLRRTISPPARPRRPPRCSSSSSSRTSAAASPAASCAQMIAIVDRQLFAMIAERRAEGAAAGTDRRPLAAARSPRRGRQPLTDQELRDELLGAGPGRPRDDRQLAGLDLRAPAAETPAPTTRLRELVRAGARRPTPTSRRRSTRACATGR